MLTISPIPAFNDNYIWLLQVDDQPQVAVVDPGAAQPVLKRLAQDDLQLSAILITHHHGDHIGGIKELLAAYPDAQVWGPAKENIPHCHHKLTEHDIVVLPHTEVKFWIFDVPGHTAGHIAYYGEGALFCGDTVFSVGCGRLFEGTTEQMHQSLNKIMSLPDDTLVYCAHEYTLDNIAFAKWVEPNNAELLAHEEQCHNLRDQDLPTVPSRLGLEKQINPFLRFDQPNVIAAATEFKGQTLQGGASVFGAVRTWKDTKFD